MKNTLIFILLLCSFIAHAQPDVHVKLYILDRKNNKVTGDVVKLVISGDNTFGAGKEHIFNAIEHDGKTEFDWPAGKPIRFTIVSDNYLILPAEQEYTPPTGLQDYSYNIMLQSNFLTFKGTVRTDKKLVKDVKVLLSFSRSDSTFTDKTDGNGNYTIKVPRAKDHLSHTFTIKFLRDDTVIFDTSSMVSQARTYQVDPVIISEKKVTEQPSPSPIPQPQPEQNVPSLTIGCFFNYCKFLEAGTEIRNPFFVDAGFEKYFSVRKLLFSCGGSINLIPAIFNELNSFAAAVPGQSVRTNNQIRINNIAELYFFYHTPFTSQPTFCFGAGLAFNYGNLSNIKTAVNSGDFEALNVSIPSTLSYMPKAYMGINYPLSKKFSVGALFFGSAFRSDAVSLEFNPLPGPPRVIYVERTHVIMGINVKVLYNFYKRS